MNKRKEPYSLPGDRDIGALFEAQSINIPGDLDEQILAEARLAVEGDYPQRQLVASRFRPWFAAAAVVMIAVGLIPQSLQSPESSLDGAAETASTRAKAQTDPESMPFAKESRDLSVAPVSKDSVVRNVARKPTRKENVAGGAAGDVELELTDSAVPTSTRLTAADASNLQPKKFSVSSFANFSIAKLPAHLVYRLDPEDWIQEMQRLESIKKYRDAQLEYRLFRQEYPTFKTIYQPQMRVTDSLTEE